MRTRKRLAEVTREWKKLETEEERCVKMGPLLKSYQGEIDRLTRRAKAAESFYLTLYKKIYEAPDPTPLLERASTLGASLLESERERTALLDEVQGYREDFKDLKNQEVTVRRLEGAVAEQETKNREMASTMEDTVRVAVEGKQAELVTFLQTQLDSFKDREEVMSAQMTDLRNELADVQRLADSYQTQLVDARSSSEAMDEGRSTELEILTSELERVRTQAALFEEEKTALETRLRDVVKETPSLSANVDQARLSQLEDELEHRERQLHDYTERLQASQARLEQESDAHRDALAKVRQEVDRKQLELEAMQAERDARPTSEQHYAVRRQVMMLKALEYNIVEDEEGGWDGDGDEMQASASDLEVLLTRKNRKLEGELTQARLATAEVEKELAVVRTERTHVSEALAKQTELVARLEDDLAAANGAAGENAAAGVPASDAIVAAAAAATSTASPVAAAAAPPAPSDDSMLGIVTAQRNRFRVRIDELESEVARLSEDKKVLTEQVRSVRGDNVELYKKIRYLESYKGNKARSSGHAAELGMATESEARYREMYEEGVSPFSVFNRKEKYKRYNDLNMAEKVTLQSSRWFLKNKVTRTILFVYALSLHLLIFFMLTSHTHANAPHASPVDALHATAHEDAMEHHRNGGHD